MDTTQPVVLPTNPLRRDWLIRWLLTAAISLLPAIAAVMMVTFWHKANLRDFVPLYNDEISYWHQVSTFHRVGFGGGYYTVNEIPPAATFTHFYGYGPWYPMLYGLISRVTGWETYSAPLINMGLLALAIGCFCTITRLDMKQLLAVGLLIGTFYPLLWLVSTNMQESFQQALAILLALVFYRLLSQPVTRRERLVGLALLTFISLTRISWSILFIPFFLLTLQEHRLWYRLLALFKAAVGMAVTLFLVNYLGAPGNSFDVIGAFAISIPAGLTALWERIQANYAGLTNPLLPFIERVQFFQTVGFVVAFAMLAVVGRFWSQRQGLSAVRLPFGETGFHFYQLSGIVAASFVLYVVGTGGEYRVMAAHLLLTLLVLLACKRYWLAGIFFAFNLLFISQFLIFHRDMVGVQFHYNHARITTFSESIRGHLVYNAETDNAWCNTCCSKPIITGQNWWRFPERWVCPSFSRPTIQTYNSR